MVQIKNILLYGAPVLAAYTYYKVNNDIEGIKADINWAWNRVPNLCETFTLSGPIALFSVFFEPFVEQLYQNNPASKTVLRNAVSIGSTYLAWHSKNEIGRTGVKYDEGHVIGNVLVFSCKAGLILTMSPDTGVPGSREAFSLKSNYICEPFGRTLNVLSDNKQASNATDINYFDFAVGNFSTDVVTRALPESLAKVTLANKIGAMWGYIGLFPFLKSTYVGIENSYINYAVGAHTTGTLLRDRGMAVWNTDKNVYTKSAVITGLIVIDVALKVGAEIITSYLIAPPVRVVQDMAGVYTSQGYEFAKGYFNDWYENLTHHQQYDDPTEL